MAEVSPQTPYQQVHELLVQHCQTMNHQARLGWLIGSSFAPLLPYLAPGESTNDFVTDLLAAAYVHGNGQDAYLRAILQQLQVDLAGHSEQVALLTALLQQEDLGPTLFPTRRATWVDGNKTQNRQEHQKVAAINAAKFLLSVLEQIPVRFTLEPPAAIDDKNSHILVSNVGTGTFTPKKGEEFDTLLKRYIKESKWRTLDKLAEMLGQYLYDDSNRISRSAISNWCTGTSLPKSRDIVIGLIIVLKKGKGIERIEQANKLLGAWNSSHLTSKEVVEIFPEEATWQNF